MHRDVVEGAICTTAMDMREGVACLSFASTSWISDVKAAPRSTSKRRKTASPPSMVSGERACTGEVVHDVVGEDPDERVEVVSRERVVLAPEQFFVGMHTSADDDCCRPTIG